jgi:hypothetical protein
MPKRFDEPILTTPPRSNFVGVSCEAVEVGATIDGEINNHFHAEARPGSHRLVVPESDEK